MDILKKYEDEVELKLSQHKYNNDFSMEECDDIEAKIDQAPSFPSKFFPAGTEYEATDLISGFMSALYKDYDTNFLDEYLNVLKKNDMVTIKNVTYEIMSTIERTLRQQISKGNMLIEAQRILLAAFLSAAVLWETPRVPAVHSALRALLFYLTEKEREVWAKACWQTLSPDALISLSDSSNTSCSTTFSDLLLRAAFCKLLPDRPTPQWNQGVPLADEVADAMMAWDEREASDPLNGCDSSERAAMLRLAGRVLAVAKEPERVSLLARIDALHVKRVARSHHVTREDDKVCDFERTEVSKLRTLFGGKKKIKQLNRRKKT